jgi:voltage-dependent anion channel protein 2
MISLYVHAEQNVAVSFTSLYFSDSGEDFAGAVFHKVSPTMEAGMSVGFNTATNQTALGLGGRFVLDPQTTVRAKIDSHARLGASYEQRLRPGSSNRVLHFQVTWSMLADTRVVPFDSILKPSSLRSS